MKLAGGFESLQDLAIDATNVYLTDLGGGAVVDGGAAGRVARIAK